MNKRLLAGLMAFCLAAGAANAAFAEDPPLSGPLHTEIATSETAAPAEPTPVPPGPAEEDPAGENTTGDELSTPTPSTTPATTATPESADPPDDEDEPAVQAVTLRSVKIQDNIKSTGELVAVVHGQSDPVDGVTYTWYRSKTGAGHGPGRQWFRQEPDRRTPTRVECRAGYAAGPPKRPQRRRHRPLPL